ncbi:MAG: peroxiredoxin [Candidatus Paracaedibacteraceae bacterium]|nr:peroxiredoxin [Candidatus Paracaedibacteraceae bacterium]
MTIQIGQKIPDISLKIATPEGAKTIQTSELFKDKKSIVFALPGAFTPLCSARHLPEFAAKKAALNAAGIDQIICLSVNDSFVMQAWAENLNVVRSIIMLCDGNSELTNALGMSIDLSTHGLGIRSKRYAMIVEDNVVTYFEVEETPGTCTVSSAEHFENFLTKKN